MHRFFASLIGLFAFFLVSSVSVATPSFTPYLVKEAGGIGTPINPQMLINANGTLFFTANDGSYALWKSDGTEIGTVLVHNVDPVVASDVFQHQAAMGNTLFLAAKDSAGAELWKSDGTQAGTVQVKDIRPGSQSSVPSLLTNANGIMMFVANGGVDTVGLWKSDGTEAGTEFIKAVNLGGFGSITNVDGTLFFAAIDAIGGFELWKSDGTASGTKMAKDIYPGGFSSSPAELTGVGGSLFFTADSGTRTHLWRSDGTETGTVQITDRIGGSGANSPRLLTNVNGTLFFTANDRASGTELYKSDGTDAGTVMIKDIYPGSPFPGSPGFSSAPLRLTDINGTLFFTADDGIHGHELWKSDGTAEGTQMVVDLTPGGGSTGFYYSGIGQPSELRAANDLLFFTAWKPSVTGSRYDHSLFVTDGTAEGTSAVLTFQNINTSIPPISELTFNGTHLFFRGGTQFGGTGVPTRFALFAIAIVPEPGSLTLAGIACVGIVGITHRRSRCGANSGLS